MLETKQLKNNFHIDNQDSMKQVTNKINIATAI
jgi:hypothetical protein